MPKKSRTAVTKKKNGPAQTQIFKISKALQQAQQCQKAGEWQKAEALYHQVLQRNHSNNRALDFYRQLGSAFSKRGKFAEAITYFQRALSFYPNHAEMQNDLGIIFGQQSQLKQAKACFETAIAEKKNFAQAYYNLGIILNEEKQFAEAITCYQKALSITPNYADAYNNLGNALSEQYKISEAIINYQKAIALNPNYAEAHNNLGVALKKQNQIAEAVASFQQAIALNSNYLDAYNNLGVTLNDKKQFKEAETCFKAILSLNPNYAEAHYNLGMVFKEQELLDKAIANFQRAVACCRHTIALKPDFADAHHTLGKALQEQGQLTEAINCFQQVLSLQPNFAEAHYNLSNALREQGKTRESLDCCQRAIALKPDWTQAHLNYFVTLLKMGNLTTGWLEYEWRFKYEEFNKNPPLKQPLWDGTELAGLRLLVHWEQGFGDTIQFARYLSLITEATVIFAGQSALKELFANLLGIDIFIVNPINKEPEIAYDVWIPLMSLPKMFATTLDNIPVCVPYLHPDSQKVEIWRNRLANTRFKIGIVWAGNPKHSNDRNRSCPLIHFAALTKLSNLTFFSLQKGEAAAQPTPEGMELISLTAELENFTDTAAAMACLDLVISVDTAVAHLAGAMGYPVWVLLPFVSEWRWLEHREDSPWYPTMRLFRQPSPGDWDSVFNQVVNELVSYLSSYAKG